MREAVDIVHLVALGVQIGAACGAIGCIGALMVAVRDYYIHRK